MNKQNMCLWYDENLYEIEETQLHAKKLTMWATFSSHETIGQFFVFLQNGDVGILS